MTPQNGNLALDPMSKAAVSETEMGEMIAHAETACDFLKALANENRLLLLCLLANGEKSVSELESALGVRQPTVSQQLARLRADNLVNARRNGKAIYYSLKSNEARQVIDLLYQLFCAPNGGESKSAGRSGRARPSGESS